MAKEDAECKSTKSFHISETELMKIKRGNEEHRIKLKSGSEVTVSGYGDGIEVVYHYKGLETYRDYYFIKESKKQPGIFMNTKREY